MHFNIEPWLKSELLDPHCLRPFPATVFLKCMTLVTGTLHPSGEAGASSGGCHGDQVGGYKSGAENGVWCKGSIQYTLAVFISLENNQSVLKVLEKSVRDWEKVGVKVSSSGFVSLKSWRLVSFLLSVWHTARGGILLSNPYSSMRPHSPALGLSSAWCRASQGRGWLVYHF